MQQVQISRILDILFPFLTVLIVIIHAVFKNQLINGILIIPNDTAIGSTTIPASTKKAPAKANTNSPHELYSKLMRGDAFLLYTTHYLKYSANAACTTKSSGTPSLNFQCKVLWRNNCIAR